MWAHENERQQQTQHFSSHNFLVLQKNLILTLDPFYHTYDTTTYKFVRGCTMSFERYRRAKNHIFREKPKKSAQTRGDLNQNDINNAQHLLWHMRRTTSLPSSSWYRLLP